MTFFTFFLQKKIDGVWLPVCLYVFALSAFIIPWYAFAHEATTTLQITICGNGFVESNETCDDGSNTAGYSTSTAGRRCEPGCQAFAAYCGDGILQPVFGETCDDANNTSGDFCSNLCVIESVPTGTTNADGGGGGSGGAGGLTQGLVPVRAETRVSVEGLAYPLADVNILKDGQVVSIVRAGADAKFRYESGSITPGPSTFGLWARDNKGTRSITFTTTFQVIQNAVTTVAGILIPPTIDAPAKKIKLGSPVTFLGQTAPQSVVGAFINTDANARGVASTTSTGDWSIALDTSDLQNESFHTAKAMFTLPAVGSSQTEKSGYSQSLSFYVGEAEIGDIVSADLNRDGKVNLVDFSILLFHWGTSNIVADLNQDGKVNLTDFSILLFHWTG